MRFENKLISFAQATSMITSNVSLSGNCTTGSMKSSMSEFLVLKQFSISIHPSTAPCIKQVDWTPSPCYWIKCNTDGASRGSPGISACGGVFRDYRASIIGCFTLNLGLSSLLHAELSGAMMSIEIVSDRGWHNLWLENDSKLVVVKVVPWQLRNRWRNYLILTWQMNFFVSHFYKEVNICADKLVSHGLSINSFVLWDLVPCFIMEDFYRNRFGLPQFRFK